jgi:hypothetical protein
MDRSPNQSRIDRMVRECDTFSVPALLLMAACATLVLLVALCDPSAEPIDARSEHVSRLRPAAGERGPGDAGAEFTPATACRP